MIRARQASLSILRRFGWGGEDPIEKIRILPAAVSVEAECQAAFDMRDTSAAVAGVALLPALVDTAFLADCALNPLVSGRDQALEEPGLPLPRHLERLVGFEPRLERERLEDVGVLLAVVGVAVSGLDHRRVVLRDAVDVVAERFTQVPRELTRSALRVAHNGCICPFR